MYDARAGSVGRYYARCAPGDCVVAARPGTSKIEDDTFALLNYVLGNGRQNYQVNTSVRPADMAFMLDDVVLVVEFDGEYWHRKRVDKDAEKAAMIEEMHPYPPHRVVRIREAPLKALDVQDVVVPQKSNSITCANLALLHMAHTVYEVANNLEICVRIEHFLTSAAVLVDEGLLMCGGCRELRPLLHDRWRGRRDFASMTLQVGPAPRVARYRRWRAASHHRALKKKPG